MLFMMTAPFTGLQAQDVIFKKNGDEIQARVLKVTESEIEYAKWSNPKGPTYVLSLGNVFMVKYENGEKDVFTDQSAPQRSQPSQAAAETSSGEKPSGGIAAPAADNDALIRSYNDHEASFVVEKQTNRKAYNWIGLLGVDASSVMSSDMLEIAIVQRESCLLHGTYMNPWPFNGHFYLELHNKTGHALYVDLGNTFRVDGSGNYKVYYDTTQTSPTCSGSEVPSEPWRTESTSPPGNTTPPRRPTPSSGWWPFLPTGKRFWSSANGSMSEARRCGRRRTTCTGPIARDSTTNTPKSRSGRESCSITASMTAP